MKKYAKAIVVVLCVMLIGNVLIDTAGITYPAAYFLLGYLSCITWIGLVNEE